MGRGNFYAAKCQYPDKEWFVMWGSKPDQLIGVDHTQDDLAKACYDRLLKVLPEGFIIKAVAENTADLEKTYGKA